MTTKEELEKAIEFCFTILTKYRDGQLVEKDRWISVKDKKPPVATIVLLAHTRDRWVVSGERIGRNYWNQFEDELSGDSPIFPTHWQPLPTPPTNQTENP